MLIDTAIYKKALFKIQNNQEILIVFIESTEGVMRVLLSIITMGKTKRKGINST
ncbi:hypothetical protein EMIT07CA2_120123 [Brevibacillus sp. IT-7CA2]